MSSSWTEASDEDTHLSFNHSSIKMFSPTSFPSISLLLQKSDSPSWYRQLSETKKMCGQTYRNSEQVGARCLVPLQTSLPPCLSARLLAGDGEQQGVIVTAGLQITQGQRGYICTDFQLSIKKTIITPSLPVR